MAGQRRERKVVSVVFCDLIGFTSRAEQLDPEDVEALLGPYHERLRSELERRGGTVEKFIGDAVMALFGAPVAHEDDAERAVRACLAIRDWAVEQGDAQVRIAVTTGEALIRLDARPEAGEGMASGDVVNTAARLQTAAPANGVLTDETTYRATRHAIEYREAEPVVAKGKEEPVAAWEALEARARLGTEVLDHVAGPLVGRERELAAVRGSLERVRAERSPQLLTIVGVPGIGKSRLLYELSRIADAEEELITWRQGRCLAYGDGVTFWALAEIVKAQAGILEADDDETAVAKLHEAVEKLVDADDASWVEAQLRPLAGLAEESELGGDQRGQAFAAWRRFFEELAAQRPLVLVFEDLQWADDGLLDFVDELVDWTSGVPLLVVCTARPELLARRPGWGGGKLNASTIALEPLSDEGTARVMAEVLQRSVLPADVQRALLDRAGGNPLYAEQFAQLYLERGSVDEVAVPETLHGLIAARLDGLPAAEKNLLQRAAVVGKVFWTGALDGGGELAAALHALERKGFVRRQRRSSVARETELAFAHALVRDVAYGQIPRAERAEKHRRVAEWIESLGRQEDHAEMLAHHWRSALELARAAGGDVAQLAERARIALRNAGDRAYGLNAFMAAEAYYVAALELWPEEDPDRSGLMFRRAEALFVAADQRREQALEEARDTLLAGGDKERAAEAEAYLSRAAWFAGRGDARAHLDRAAELLEGTGPSISKARVLSFGARLRFLGGDFDEPLRMAHEALALAEQFDLDDLKVHALTTIGSAKNKAELSSGHAELERALEIGLAANSPLVPTVYNNLGVEASDSGDLGRAAELYRESLHAAERLGDRDSVKFARGNLLYVDFFTGLWDELVENADRFIAECETSPHYQEGSARLLRAYVRLARSDQAGALADWDRALVLAREVKDPSRLLGALLQVARGYALLGRVAEALEFASEALDLARTHLDFATALGQITPVAKQLGVREDVRDILASAPENTWKKTSLAEAEGDFVRAAELFAERGAVTLEAEDRFCAAEELIEIGRRAEGEAQLEKALSFYRSVGATFYIARSEELLAKAS